MSVGKRLRHGIQKARDTDRREIDLKGLLCSDSVSLSLTTVAMLRNPILCDRRGSSVLEGAVALFWVR